MSITRRISDHRPKIVLATLIVLALASLASGAHGGSVGEGVRTLVGVASMPFLLAFNRIQAGYEYTAGLILDYDQMRSQAQAGQLEIADLRQRLAQAEETPAENRRLRNMLAFQRNHSQFTLMPAQVIQHLEGILTIDRGAVHNIRESMCVITPDGIIGLVTRVGPLTANVVTLQSADCKIDAMIKWNRVRGRVHGSGNDLRAICTMHYIDLKDEVREGDWVVTSPDSVFPSGYRIGRVVGVPQRGQLAQSADIVPAADPFRVDEVFVLLGASLDWRELAGQMEQWYVTPVDFELLDVQTIQERLAP